MIEFDHVLIAVRDLDTAARDLQQHHGLASIPGGRHTGLGTSNRIVPLGPNYVELITVIDEEEARSSPLAQWVARLSSSGDRLAGVCLRTDDIDEVATRLGTVPIAMERARPDGGLLKWRLAGLTDTLVDPALPFFIQWDVSIEELPGNERVEHSVQPQGIEWVEIAHDPDTIRARLGDNDLDLRVVGGDRGVRKLAIATTDGTVVIES